MKTLELKDICGYLPYGLKYQWTNMKSVRLISMTDEVDYRSQHCGSTAWEWMMHRQARPILRPSSDLTKEITHRGEKFVPLDVFNDRGHFIEFDAAGLLYTVGGCMDSDWLMVFDKFHEWMFDYRGLISAGLAIAVNTLPENPYAR